MRLVLVVLAVLSLAVRWADSPCGCAEHNGWLLLAGHSHGPDEAESDADPAAPAASPGCSGECGRAVYASVSKPTLSGSLLICGLAPAADEALPAETSPVEPFCEARRAPSRAMLSVYRI